MKTSKTSHPTLSQEECGVWLDPVQLKGKAKQKRLVRPISKLLNPLAKSEGYSLAVALNFTQTKIEMPKTKQSTISTFFTSHQRVINKMSSSGLQNFSPVKFSVSSSASKTNQGHSSSLQKPKLDESGVSLEEESESFTETCQHSPFLNETEEEMAEDSNQPPSNKKRKAEKSWLQEDNKAPPQAWSQDPLFNCNQYSESQLYQSDEECTTPKYVTESEVAFFQSLQSEEAFGNVMDVKGRTSIQKPVFTSSISEDDGKENNSKSNKRALSPIESKQPETKNILHQKQRNQPSNKEGTDEWIDTRRTKMNSLPHEKDLRSREPDENTLANLFTQDSEGFRVISHRGLQTRSPLKDHSNLVPGTGRTYKSFEEEEDDEEMLFTQDSQGNMVIKH